MGWRDNANALLTGLTIKQREGLRQVLIDVHHASVWSWSLPVLLRDRCWMRLDRIQLSQLRCYLPPERREESPELVHYRMLIADGVEPLVAQQVCWQHFGMDDCQRSLRDYWQSCMVEHHGWTACRYRQLVIAYRERIERGDVVVPMLVLARRGSNEQHRLHWICFTPSLNDVSTTVAI